MGMISTAAQRLHKTISGFCISACVYLVPGVRRQGGGGVVLWTGGLVLWTGSLTL